MIRSRFAATMCVLLVLLFSVALLVPVQYLPFDTRYDKLQHALFFAVITVLLAMSVRLPMLKIGLLVSLFAVVSELTQNFIPYRSGNLDDLIADMIGVIVSCLSIALLQVLYGKIGRQPR